MDSKTVLFSNTVSNVKYDGIFDTVNSDGVGNPTSARVVATLDQTSAWKVLIETTSNSLTTVRTFSGNSNAIDVTWDGKNANGMEVEDDTYFVTFQVGNATKQSKIVSKHKIGDVLLLFQVDKSIFPGDWKAVYGAYKDSIKQKLQPYLASGAISKISVIAPQSTDELVSGRKTTGMLKSINAELSHPLRIFYVNCHGGIHTPLPGETPQNSHPYFSVHGIIWYSALNENQFFPEGARNLIRFDIRDQLAIANYGSSGNDPPGIVWIDSCDSAGGVPHNEMPAGAPGTGNDMWDFGNAFSSGNLFGIFLGWNGYCRNYKADAPPADDWTYWRDDMWSQLLTPSNNYTSAFNKTVRDFRVHGYHSIYTSTPEYRARIFGNGSDSF